MNSIGQIIYSGVKNQQLSAEDKSVILTNKVSLILISISVLVILLNSLFVGSVNMTARLSLMIALGLLTILLNYKGYNNISRHFTAGMPIFILLTLPLLMNDKMAEHDMVWYPYLAISLSILPVIIFNPKKQWLPLVIWSIFYAVMVMGIDYFIFTSRNIGETLVVYVHYALFKIPQIAIYLLINLSFYYIIITNRGFEETVENQNLELVKDAQLIKTQSEEINHQNQLLEAKKKEIELANRSLEDKVKERTAELEIKNKQLMDYAFHNAHEVRGPLSRLLGLTMLLENKIVDESQRDFVLEKIAYSAKELDDVIRAINESLKIKAENES